MAIKKQTKSNLFGAADERALIFFVFWQDLLASEAKPKLVRPSKKRS